MKKIIVINLLIISVITVLFINELYTRRQLSHEYDRITSDIDALVLEYQDSTKLTGIYFNKARINKYAKMIEDDSLRSFIIVQSRQWDYFYGYQTKLKNFQSTLAIDLGEKTKVFYILIVISILALIFNSIVFVRHQRRASDDTAE